jgi:hypothetical protein
MTHLRKRKPSDSAQAGTAPPPPVSLSPRSGLLTLLALAYVALVLLADVFLDHFMRRPMFHGADLFKFTTWFLIPFVFCLPRMDWGYYGIKRWVRFDYYLLAAAIILELLAVFSVRLFPTLRAALPDLRNESLLAITLWNLSWLIGWEFIHRYLLLRRLSVSFPRFGWLLIPIYEGAYHLVWPTLLMPAGMVIFSLIATYWSLKRRNGLLPFLAHLIIEFQLTVFLILA